MGRTHLISFNTCVCKQQRAFSYEERLAKYSRITTAVLNEVGYEEEETCDFCGNPYSLNLSKLMRDNKEINYSKKQRKKEVFSVGREWIPLAGSMGSDAQALPGMSRSLRACAICLYSAQYLPYVSLLINGSLAVFQSSSEDLWYDMVKEIVEHNRVRLNPAADSIEILGSAEGTREAVTRLLTILRRIRFEDYDPNTTMTMYLYSNRQAGDIRERLIPNSALNFLHKTANSGFAKDIEDLTSWEVVAKNKRAARYDNFFNKIVNSRDYEHLYPSEKKDNKNKKNKGQKKEEEERVNVASPGLYLLYQIMVVNYSLDMIRTAYDISKFIKEKTNEDIKSLHVNLDNDFRKQNRVKKWIMEMAKKGEITFDKYYKLFVREDLRNRWWLVKYYLSTKSDDKLIVWWFDNIEYDATDTYSSEPERDRVVKVCNMLYDMIFKERGPLRMRKLLSNLAGGERGAIWLDDQFKMLAEKNQEFVYDEYWKDLCNDEDRQNDLYQFIYLLRLLFTTRVYKEKTQSEVDAIIA